ADLGESLAASDRISLPYICLLTGNTLPYFCEFTNPPMVKTALSQILPLVLGLCCWACKCNGKVLIRELKKNLQL
ncbi:hypothetical protein ACOKW7_15405, partial [Limnospira platensis CENA597]|uniref:hypothetical protein n=1 Tax=Limnospira platensis TaxID=118562 RepID=UPI003DA136F5